MSPHFQDSLVCCFIDFVVIVVFVAKYRISKQKPQLAASSRP